MRANLTESCKAAITKLKSETVLVIASILAVISIFFNPPGKEYLEFIDFRVLGILLSLMLVMAGFQVNGVFSRLGGKLISGCNSTRKLAVTLIFMCFLSSMLLTNDVALITFVPFALLTLKMGGKEDIIIPVVVAQTIAANLGSMLTPMGNPQNLYLYGISGMTMGEFIALMLPYTLVAAILLCLCILRIKSEKLSPSGNTSGEETSKKQIIVYCVLFLLCILTVVRLVEWYVITAVTVLVVAVMDRRVFKKTDYSLLLTFIAFFIFIGNMGQIEAVRKLLSSLIEGRELLVSVASSQVVSNVPAAILLSGFTDNYSALIVGTNLGGLGTLIASMASLISYKQFVNAYPQKKGKYFAEFTIMNIVFLVILALAVFIVGY